MIPLRTLIVDDEVLARERLARLLAKFEDKVRIIAQADSGITGLEAIQAHQPELIFLDVQMPGLNGFELLAELQDRPHIVFVTAYDRYATRAFEVNAVDYLVKPVREERLAEAVTRVLNKRGTGSGELDRLIKYLHRSETQWLQRLTVRKGNRILFIDAAQVAFFKAEDKYTIAVGPAGEEIVSYSLSELESELDPGDFVRIHRGYLINRHFLHELKRLESGTYSAIINLKRKRELPVSRNGLKALMG